MPAYLTVDDAPSSDLPEKLEILEAHEAPALFFCEGRRLADYPEHARRAVAAGHHLGNHLYSHSHASDLSVAAFRDELTRTESLLEDVYDRTDVSRPARVFRFPYGDKGGERADRFQRILADREYAPPDPTRITYQRDDYADDCDWFWTVSVADWTVETRAELREQVASVADRLDDASDDVILFHDGGNSPTLFEAFLELLGERDVALADPVDLLPDGDRRGK